MDELKRFAAVSILIWATLFFALLAGGNLPSLLPPTDTDIQTVLEEQPEDQRISVDGAVTAVEDDYVSEKGNTYPRFIVNDGTASILVFCSTYTGRTAVEKGDTVTVTGTFQLFYETPEIYTECSEIHIGE